MGPRARSGQRVIRVGSSYKMGATPILLSVVYYEKSQIPRDGE